MKHKLITIVYRLPLNLKTHIVLNIFEQSGYNIDDLSQDIYRCYRNSNNKRIYQQSFLEDLYFLNDLYCLDIPKEVIDEETQNLFKAVDSFESNIHFEPRLRVRLIRIDLERPDTAYFHFVEL